RRHTRCYRDWSSDVCSSDLNIPGVPRRGCYNGSLGRNLVETVSRTSWVAKTPGVCGGDARIRKTRITVAGLVERRAHGLSDAEKIGRASCRERGERRGSAGG